MMTCSALQLVVRIANAMNTFIASTTDGTAQRSLFSARPAVGPRCHFRRAGSYLIEDISVDDRLQLTAEVERRRRHQLGEEHDDQIFDGVDPEYRRRHPAPAVLARRGRDLGAHRVDHHREAEAKADT